MTNLILEALIFCPYLADRPNFDRLAVSQFLTQSKNILQEALLYQHKWAKKLQIWISLFLWNRAHPSIHTRLFGTAEYSAEADDSMAKYWYQAINLFWRQLVKISWTSFLFPLPARFIRGYKVDLIITWVW